VAVIFVADDVSVIRDTLRALLEKQGHTVLEAANGVECLALFRTKQPDLVITDMIMPEKDGVETIREIRRRFPEVKIIAISDGGSKKPASFLDFAQDSGAHRVLSKMQGLGGITALVNELLSSAEPGQRP